MYMFQMQDMDPETRWSPQQALQHPFLTGQRFTGPFQPQSHPPQPHACAAASPHSAGGARHAAHPPDPSPFLYHSPMAAMLATSPEVHAHAHAAAMAAVQVPPLATPLLWVKLGPMQVASGGPGRVAKPDTSFEAGGQHQHEAVFGAGDAYFSTEKGNWH